MKTRHAQFNCTVSLKQPVQNFLFSQSDHYLLIKKISLTAHLANQDWIEVAGNYALEIVSTNDINGTIPHTVLLAALLEQDAVLPVFEVNLPYPLDHYDQVRQAQPVTPAATQLQIRLLQNGPTALDNVRIELECVPVPQVICKPVGVVSRKGLSGGISPFHHSMTSGYIVNYCQFR